MSTQEQTENIQNLMAQVADLQNKVAEIQPYVSQITDLEVKVGLLDKELQVAQFKIKCLEGELSAKPPKRPGLE